MSPFPQRSGPVVAGRSLTKNRERPYTGVGQKSALGELMGAGSSAGGFHGEVRLSRSVTKMSLPPRPDARAEANISDSPSSVSIGQPSRASVLTVNGSFCAGPNSSPAIYKSRGQSGDFQAAASSIDPKPPEPPRSRVDGLVNTRPVEAGIPGRNPGSRGKLSPVCLGKEHSLRGCRWRKRLASRISDLTTPRKHGGWLAVVLDLILVR